MDAVLGRDGGVACSTFPHSSSWHIYHSSGKFHGIFVYVWSPPPPLAQGCIEASPRKVSCHPFKSSRMGHCKQLGTIAHLLPPLSLLLSMNYNTSLKMAKFRTCATMVLASLTLFHVVAAGTYMEVGCWRWTSSSEQGRKTQEWMLSPETQ